MIPANLFAELFNSVSYKKEVSALIKNINSDLNNLRFEFEFRLVIYKSKNGFTNASSGSDIENNSFVLRSFNIPAVGISWTNDAQLNYHPVPKIDFGAVEMEFSTTTEYKEYNSYQKAYENRFNDLGTLRLIKESETYDALVSYYMSLDNKYAYPILKYKNIHVNKAVPKVNITGSDLLYWSGSFTFDRCEELMKF